MTWKQIKWYHYNKYSNPEFKILLYVNIILGLAVSVTDKAGFVATVVAYIWLLCNRGFGEPSYRKYKACLEGTWQGAA